MTLAAAGALEKMEVGGGGGEVDDCLRGLSSHSHLGKESLTYLERSKIKHFEDPQSVVKKHSKFTETNL